MAADAGAEVGVVFAGDFVTVFRFWELMAIGSTLAIWRRARSGGFRAGMRYLIVHLFGGTQLRRHRRAQRRVPVRLAFDA